MMNPNTIPALQAKIKAHRAEQKPLRICGHGSKASLHQASDAEVINTESLSGVLEYQPTELLLRVGAGTPLAEMDQVLAESGQCLPCDALSLQGRGTAGGALAAGLSGPRRVAFGQIRDFILGVSLIDGHGRVLNVGGQVIKNVAGYDVSRMLAGTWGKFGLFTSINFRTLPLPKAEQTLIFNVDDAMTALTTLQAAVNAALPISASLLSQHQLSVRLCGNHASVAQAARYLQQHLGTAENIAQVIAHDFWQRVRSVNAPCFQPPVSASTGHWWRVAVPPLTPLVFQHPLLHTLTPAVIEWHGALRWCYADLSPAAWQALQAEVLALGGAAMAWRSPTAHAATAPYPITFAMGDTEQKLHQSLKSVFDPDGLF